MLKKELTTQLTLHDIGLHSSLEICIVCDIPLLDTQKVVMLDVMNVVSGWLCPECTAWYDYDDNLLDIGEVDIYCDIRGRA